MRKILQKVGLIALVGSLTFNLSGCMFLSDNQKTAIDVYLNKKSVDELMEEAQDAINEANYLQCLVNYKVDKLNKDKSMTDVFTDADTWDFRAIKGAGAGYWKGSSTRENEVVKTEEAYIVKLKDTDGYDLYTSKDNGDTWVRSTATGIWSGLSIMSIDYSKLIGCEGLEVEKDPITRDGVLQWKITGELTYEQARNFLGGLENALDIHPDENFSPAKYVEAEIFVNTDSQPMTVSLKFHPDDGADAKIVYKLWEVRLSYTDYDAYSSLTVPRNVQLGYVTQEEEKDREESFNLNNIAIELESEEETTEAFELDEDDELLE